MSCYGLGLMSTEPAVFDIAIWKSTRLNLKPSCSVNLKEKEKRRMFIAPKAKLSGTSLKTLELYNCIYRLRFISVDILGQKPVG